MSTSKADKEVIAFIEKLNEKKTKEKYKLIDTFTTYLFPDSGPMMISRESISLLLEGDYDKKQSGLWQFAGKKGIAKKLKRSSISALQLIHKLMFSHPMAKIVKIFFKALDPDMYLMMNLGKHFLAKYNKKDENISLDIIKFIKAERPRMKLEEFVMKEESYAKLDVILKQFVDDPEQQK